MRFVVIVLLSLLACPFTQWISSNTLGAPVEIVMPSVPSAAIAISADAILVPVGGTITLTGIPLNIGLPYYTLTLSSGAVATITYQGEVISAVSDGYLSRDDHFEIMSADANMGQVIFLLRALMPGSEDAMISVTGEIRTPEGAFMWGSAQSQALTLTVTN
ncbi:MAG: hypothetical protein ABI835_03470 [Chloroflexota bacterium]